MTEITIGPLQTNEVDAADRVFRLAFGTRTGLPDPMRFGGDAALIRTRFGARHTVALAAHMDGELVGSSFATNWGTMGIYGPLSVRPDLWDKGIAKQLMEQTMEVFSRWGTQNVGLFTPADSPKHVGLYQKFDFWPRLLTAIMARPVALSGDARQWSRYSEVPQGEKSRCLEACRGVTGSLLEGLDLSGEINSVESQKLGDTILLWDGSELSSFAVCHWGPGTEAGSGVCYVKFGAVRAGNNAGEAFEKLLGACEAIAKAQGLPRLVAGVNTARRKAYRKMISLGFRTFIQGVSMQRPDAPSYDRTDVYAVDDWR